MTCHLPRHRISQARRQPRRLAVHSQDHDFPVLGWHWIHAAADGRIAVVDDRNCPVAGGGRIGPPVDFRTGSAEGEGTAADAGDIDSPEGTDSPGDTDSPGSRSETADMVDASCRTAGAAGSCPAVGDRSPEGKEVVLAGMAGYHLAVEWRKVSETSPRWMPMRGSQT